MYLPIEHIEGVVPAVARRLKDFGIYELEELVTVAGTATARYALATEAGVPVAEITGLWQRALALQAHLQAAHALLQHGQLIFLEDADPEPGFVLREPAAAYGVGIGRGTA